MAETRLIHIIAAVASLGQSLKKLKHAGSSFWFAESHRLALGLHHCRRRCPERPRSFRRRGDFQALEDGRGNPLKLKFLGQTRQIFRGLTR